MKLTDLNTNKYFIGVMMIILNLGSRFLVKELTETQIDILNKDSIRKVVIFTIVFIATRDIHVSIVVSIIFIICINFLFNEKSKFSIITIKNNDKKISRDMYNNAKKIIELYLSQN